MRKTLSILLSGLLAFNGLTSLSTTRVSAETKENVPHIVFESKATNMKKGDTATMKLNIENPTDIDYIALEVDFAYPMGYETQVLEVGADDESTIYNDNVTSITRLGDNTTKFIRCAAKYEGGDVNYNGTRNYFTIHFQALKDIPHLFKVCGDNFKLTIVKTDGTEVTNKIIFEGFKEQAPQEPISAEVEAMSSQFNKGNSIPVAVRLKNVSKLKTLNIMLYNDKLNKGTITNYLINDNIFPMDTVVDARDDSTGMSLYVALHPEVVFGFEDEMIITAMVELNEDVDYLAKDASFIRIYGTTADGDFSITPELIGMDGSGTDVPSEPNTPTIHDSSVSMNFLDRTEGLQLGDTVKAQIALTIPSEFEEVETRLKTVEPYAHDLKLLSAELSDTAKELGFTLEFDGNYRESKMIIKNPQNRVLQARTALIDVEFMTTTNKPGLFNPDRRYLTASIVEGENAAVVFGNNENIPAYEKEDFAVNKASISPRILDSKPEYKKGDLVTVDYAARNISEAKRILLTQKYTDKLKIVRIDPILRELTFDGIATEDNKDGFYSISLTSDTSDISMIGNTSILSITYEVQEDSVKLFNPSDVMFRVEKADGKSVTIDTTILNDNEEPQNPDNGEGETPKPPTDGGDEDKPQPPIDGGDEDKPQPPTDGGDEDKPQPPTDNGGDENVNPQPPTDNGGDEEKPQPPVDNGEGEEKPQPPVDGGNGEETPQPPTDNGEGEETPQPPTGGGDTTITPEDIPVVDDTAKDEGSSDPVKTGDSSNIAKSVVSFGLAGLVLLAGISLDRKKKRA